MNFPGFFLLCINGELEGTSMYLAVSEPKINSNERI